MRCIESAIAIYGQVLVKVPTISIDKTDGCMVYLSKDSLTTQLVTAKSSEMNILVPDETGEFVSFAVLVLCLIRCVNRTRNN